MKTKILLASWLLLTGMAFGQGQFGGGAAGTGTGGSPAFSAITSATNNSAAMAVGTGASLVPSGQGQIPGTNIWIPIATAAIYPAQPTLAFGVGGGALGNLTFFVVVTYVGPSTVVPSGEVKITTSGCTANCTLTVTMPTTCTAGNLPSGVTGCTVWDTPGGIAGVELQQAANANCVNITTATCVVTTAALGSSLVWPTTTGINPPNFQAVTQPNHIINPFFMQKGDGKYYPVAGVDVSRLNVLPDPVGTFTWTDRFFINSSGTAPIISNALFSVHHSAGDGATGNGAGIDDRSVGFEYLIPASTAFTDEQFLTQYNEFTFFSNFTCGPTASESCGAAGRFVTTDDRPTNSGNLVMGGQGLTGASGTFFRNSSGNSTYGSCGGPCITGVRGSSINLISGTGTGQYFAGLAGVVSDQSGVSTGFNSVGLVVSLGTRFAGGGFGNAGIWIDNTWTNAADWSLRSEGTAKSVFNGPAYLPTSTWIADAGLVSLQGSLSLLGGGLTTSQISAPAVPQITQGGAAGSTSYTYAVCFVDSNGGQVCSSAQANAAGNATLDGTNFNIVRILNGCGAGGTLLGAVSVNVYRTASSGTPSSTGKIGSIAVPTECITAGANSAVLNDTGLAGDSAPLPTGNNTGGVVASGVIKGTNTVRLTADSSGITAVTPGTTFLTLPALLPNTNYSFICELLYSQATAAVLDGFSVQAATNAATRWDAWGSMDTTNPASTTVTGSKGSALNVTTTTSTPVVSATPGAITTVFQARLSGSIQVGTSVPSLQIAAFTGNASDAVTIKAGSFCTVTP